MVSSRKSNEQHILRLRFTGMKLKTNFSKESPVWLLGKCYHRKIDSPASDLAELGTDVAAFQSQSDVCSFFFNSYVLYLTKKYP